MDKTNIVPHDLDLVNQPKPIQVIPQLFLHCILIQTAEVHVPTSIALLSHRSDLHQEKGGIQMTLIRGRQPDEPVLGLIWEITWSPG